MSKTFITAGMGYSFDTQQLARQNCYDIVTTSISSPTSVLKTATAMSFSEIQKALKRDVGVRGKWRMFSASAESQYMRAMQDTHYSFSLNYYQYVEGTASFQLNGSGVSALNDLGKSVYNKGRNKFFGIVCGDHYITSAQVGALLVMGVNIVFNSHADKTAFAARVSGTFGNILSALYQIGQITSSYKISGSASIHAFQLGGEPAQLSGVLSKDAKNNFHMAQCNLDNINMCVSAASGLLGYAQGSFQDQISFEDNRGLAHLGLEWMTYSSLKNIGLKVPPSFVTPTVVRAREWLSITLEENKYYSEKFFELIHGYPEPWIKASSFYLSLQNFHSRAKSNVAILMDHDPYRGAIGCFDQPNKCKEIATSISAKLEPITPDELSMFNEFVGHYYSYKEQPLYFNGMHYIWTVTSHPDSALLSTINERIKQFVSSKESGETLDLGALGALIKRQSPFYIEIYKSQAESEQTKPATMGESGNTAEDESF